MRTRIVGLMFLLSVMSYFDRTILSIAAPGIMKEFALSETQMGVVFSSFLLSYTILMIPGGRLADLFGPRLVFTLFALGSGAATAAFAFGGAFGAIIGIIPAFALLRLLFGVVTSPIYPTAGKMTANWMAPTERARTIGIINAGAGLGGAVSPILFAWMIGVYGWRMSFALAGGVTMALGVVWHIIARDRPPDAPAAIDSSKAPVQWGRLFRNRRLMELAAGYFAIDYFEYIFFYWIYYYLGEVKKMGKNESAAATTALFLVMMCMYPLGGWVADHLGRIHGKYAGRRAVGIGGVVLSNVCLFAGVNIDNVWLSVALIALALGFVSASDVVYWAATIDVSGEDAGACGGIVNAVGNLGGFFAPIVTPWIAARFGWTWSLYFAGLLVLATVLVWIRREDHSAAGL